MNKSKAIKRLLGNKYSYTAFMTEKHLMRLKQNPPASFQEAVVAMLIADCLKIETVLFRSPTGIDMINDIFVKDAPDSLEWIYFDSLSNENGIKENTLATALDCYANDHQLSYTKCCFTHLDGKSVRPGKSYCKTKP